MPSERRREAILEAVEAQVVDHDMELTSKELAKLAGVAEGTLFRVFGSKEELLVAAFAHHLAQVASDESWKSKLADSGADLDDQLARYIDVITGRIGEWTHLLGVLHRFLRGTGEAKARDLRKSAVPEMQRVRALYVRTLDQFAESCRMMLAPHTDALRVSLDDAVAFVQSTATSLAVSRQFHDFGLSAEQSADMVLHGVIGPSHT